MHNKMPHTIIVGLVGALTAIAFPAAQAAGGGKLSLSTGFDYSSGKYGGTTSTDILYIPVTGKYETGPWSFKLTVPYIRITGPGNVVRGIGSIKGKGTVRTTESGMGDMVAAATFNAYSGGPSDPLVDLTAKVKLGTADENKGLGTGKNDYAAQVDVYQGIDHFTVFGTVGYKVLGSPAGTTLNNVAYGSLGGGYRFNRQTSGGLIMDLSQKAFAAGFPQRDLMAYVIRKLNKTWKAQGYVVRGFANGSPNWEAGAVAIYSF